MKTLCILIVLMLQKSQLLTYAALIASVFVGSANSAWGQFKAQSQCEHQVVTTEINGKRRDVSLPRSRPFELVFVWRDVSGDQTLLDSATLQSQVRTEDAIVSALEGLALRIPGIWDALPNQVSVVMKSIKGSGILLEPALIFLQALENPILTTEILLHEFGHLVLARNLPHLFSVNGPISNRGTLTLFNAMDEFFSDVFAAMWSRDKHRIQKALMTGLTERSGFGQPTRLGDQSLLDFNLWRLNQRIFDGEPVMDQFIDQLKKARSLEDYLVKQSILSQADLHRGHTLMGWARKKLGQHWHQLDPEQLLIPRMIQLIDDQAKALGQTKGMSDVDPFKAVEKLNIEFAERLGWK